MENALICEKSLQKSLRKFSGGEGNTLFCEGSPVIDFVGGGENCLGYSSPVFVDAVRAAAGSFATFDAANAVANMLTLGQNLGSVAITSGAKDAESLAIEIAKNYHRDEGQARTKIVNHSRLSPEIRADFSLLKGELDAKTAAFIFEPILDSSLTFIGYDYLINAYALAKSLDILFICDESRIGFGRLGTRFCYELFGIQPDMVLLGRGLGGGINCGALLCKSALSKGEYDFESASSVALSAIFCVNSFLSREKLAEINELGDYLMSKLVRFNKYNFVADVRGKGLFAVIELSGTINSARIAGQMEKSGFLVGQSQGNLLKFTPPLTITRAEIDLMTEALSEIFASTNI